MTLIHRSILCSKGYFPFPNRLDPSAFDVSLIYTGSPSYCVVGSGVTRDTCIIRSGAKHKPWASSSCHMGRLWASDSRTTSWSKTYPINYSAEIIYLFRLLAALLIFLRNIPFRSKLGLGAKIRCPVPTPPSNP